MIVSGLPPQPLLQVAGSPPAGGAALGEVIGATAGAGVLTALLLVLAVGHRTGRLSFLAHAAAFAERRSGLPGWVALPTGLATVGLLTALFGMYWDISLHIDEGRDAGPLANPAHYFILGGLFEVFAAGVLAVALPTERPGPTALRLTRAWHAPLGGVLLTGCAAFALIAFPLDDVWHRLFGQDVTLWGPTHLMLIGGPSLSLVAIGILIVEGLRSRRQTGIRREGRMLHGWTALLMGGLLIGLSTVQAEFDFGAPQFRLVFQPLLIMVAAGVGLVAARLFLGRGGALAAVAFFLLIRGVLSLLVGPVLGETTPHLPLYLAEAVLVELVGLRLSRDRPLVFGLSAGALIGTVGLAAEWGWSQLWMPLPWPSELLPEALLIGLAGALAGSVLGAFIGTSLRAVPATGRRSLRLASAAALAIVVALTAGSLLSAPGGPVRATVALSDVEGGPNRSAGAVVTLDPPSAADEAVWLTATSWQGGGLRVDPLRRVGPARFVTVAPIPLHGNWKSLVRLHRGSEHLGLPLYAPQDPAIPAAAITSPARFERSFVSDKQILQREFRGGSAALTAAGYLVVLLITASIIGALGWGLLRLGAGGPRQGSPRRPAWASALARRIASAGAARRAA
jgi:hypothetical protein